MKKTQEKMQVVMVPTTPNDETGNGATAIFFDYSRDWGHLYVTSRANLKKGDWFVWQSGMTGEREVHQFHSDAGYGIKTYTEYNEKNESSLIVNWSGNLGKVEAATDPTLKLDTKIHPFFIITFMNSKGTITEARVEVMKNSRGDIADGGQKFFIITDAEKNIYIKEVLPTKRIAASNVLSEKLEKMIRKYEDNPHVILGDKIPSIDELKKLKKGIVSLEKEQEIHKDIIYLPNADADRCVHGIDAAYFSFENKSDFGYFLNALENKIKIYREMITTK